jgi:hypothetical protein
MASGTPTFTYEIGAVLALILVAIGALYAFNRYMQRRFGALATRETHLIVADRAYNQIRIGRAAADRLARSGTDVSEARALLDRAESAREARSYDDSIALVKKAQEQLALARSGAAGLASLTSPERSAASARPEGSSPTPYPAGTTAKQPSELPEVGESPPLVSGTAAIEGPVPTIEPPRRPPKNKLEARFQLSLATDELKRAEESSPRPKGLPEALRLRSAGQEAFDREDFTEALRLALRSRRTLGSRVEGLPASTPASPPTTGPAPTGGGSARPASSPAPGSDRGSGAVCPACGRVTGPDDRFCRTCGAPMVAPACTHCGAPLQAGDRFCGKCGTVQT